MIQSDCNLGPNILKPIKNEHRSAKNQNKISGGGGRRGALTIGWNDTPLVLSTLSCLRHSVVSSVGPFGIYGDGPESGLTLTALLYLTFFPNKVFWVMWDTNCIDSWHLRSSSLFILTRVPTRKKYRILCYPLRSNSGWLPIRCAYFIL